MGCKDKIKAFFDHVSKSSCVGIFWAILSTFLFTYAYFAAQQVIESTTNFPVLELVFVRSTIQLVLLIPVVWKYDKQVLYERKRWSNLFYITLVGYWCLVGGYWALDFIPASILLPISATCPLFAIVFSYCILKEKAYTLDGVCGIFGFIGVVIIFRPTFIFGNYKEHEVESQTIAKHHNELSYVFGCMIALFFGAGKALIITLIRKWARDCGTNSPDLTPTILYPSAFGFAVTPLIMILTGKTLILPTTGYARFALFIASFCSLLGSWSIACAMKTQTSPVVGVIRNLDIIWIFLLQYAVMDIWPSLWSIIGAFFVVFATILVVFREKLCVTGSSCFKCHKRDYEEINAEAVEEGKGDKGTEELKEMK